MTRFLLCLFIVIVSISAIKSLWFIVNTTAPDFSVYYEGARYLTSGRLLYQNVDLFTGIGYPPNSLLFYIPFRFVPYQNAQALWTIISVIALVGSVWLSIRLAGIKNSLMLVALTTLAAFLTFPVKFTLGMGQSNLITLFFILLGIYWWQNNYKGASGIFLGLAIIMKPQVSLLILGAFVTGHTIMALIAGMTFGLSVLVTGLLYGWINFQHYFSQALPYMAFYRGREVYYNQGIRAMISRLLPDSIAHAVILIVTAFILSVSVWVIWKRKLDFYRASLLLLITVLLIEPLSWQHHYVFLIPAIILILTLVKNSLQLFIITVSGILIALNLDRTSGPSGGLWIYNLIDSHVGIGTLILYILAIKKL